MDGPVTDTEMCCRDAPAAGSAFGTQPSVDGPFGTVTRRAASPKVMPCPGGPASND